MNKRPERLESPTPNKQGNEPGQIIKRRDGGDDQGRIKINLNKRM